MSAFELVQTPGAEKLIEIFSPVTVDMDTGTIRMTGTIMGQFKTFKRGDAANDFVATAGADVISLRVWKRPVQIVFIYNNQTVFSGTCSEIN
jgi:hypothetical protein